MLKEIIAQAPSILIADVKQEEKAHPWRRCPKAMHFVKEHQARIESSNTHPDGLVVVRAHCAINPSGKDELSHEEIQNIRVNYFNSLLGSPTAGVLVEFKNADAYDQEIRGWTQYWNEVLQPDEALNPNLVKALIATESGFRPDPQENKIACGLMQIMPKTRIYLQDIHGELNDYLVIASEEELFEPSTNICAGIRWLFRKRIIAKSKLGRQATWIEAIADYKDYLDKIIAKAPYNERPMIKLKDYYFLLEKNKK